MSTKTKKNTPAATTAVTTLTAAQTALQNAQAEVARLKTEADAQANARTAEVKRLVDSLPGMFGVATVGEVVAIIKKAVKVPGAGRKRTITDETKAKVIEMVNARHTGEEISAALNISIPSIQAIKKAAGLVRAHKTPAAAAVA